jgi:hypothetical protein
MAADLPLHDEMQIKSRFAAVDKIASVFHAI